MSNKAKKVDAMMLADGIPVLDLKKKFFIHEVPAHLNLEMVIQWKQFGSETDTVMNIKAFAIEDKKLKVVNRDCDTMFVYPVNKLKRVFLMPIEREEMNSVAE